MGRFHTIIPASVFSPSELLLLGSAGREGTAVQPTSPSFEEQHHTRTWHSPPGKFELASPRSAGAPRTQRCRLGGQTASTVTVFLHVPNASEPQAAKTGPWQVETSLRKGICRHESTHPSDIGSGALPSSRAALMLARFSLNHLSADSSNIDIDAPVPHSIRLYRNSIRPAHRLIIRHTDRPSLNPPQPSFRFQTHHVPHQPPQVYLQARPRRPPEYLPRHLHASPPAPPLSGLGPTNSRARRASPRILSIDTDIGPARPARMRRLPTQSRERRAGEIHRARPLGLRESAFFARGCRGERWLGSLADGWIHRPFCGTSISISTSTSTSTSISLSTNRREPRGNGS